MSNGYDRDELIEALAECLDRKGCDGVTIWIATDGRLQISMRNKKTDGWTIVLADELEEGLSRATEDFLRGNRNDTRRVVKTTKQRRREISDLA